MMENNEPVTTNRRCCTYIVVFFQAHIKKNNPDVLFKDNREYKFVFKVNKYEY